MTTDIPEDQTLDKSGPMIVEFESLSESVPSPKRLMVSPSGIGVRFHEPR